MKTTHYVTAAASDSEGLDKEVNTLLKEGYKLWGSPYSSRNNEGYPFLFQAMVKEDVDWPKGQTK